MNERYDPLGVEGTYNVLKPFLPYLKPQDIYYKRCRPDFKYGSEIQDFLAVEVPVGGAFEAEAIVQEMVKSKALKPAYSILVLEQNAAALRLNLVVAPG